MKWLKRGLWITAWGVWAWLGVGLYRELPRDLGLVLWRLPTEPAERFDGFLRLQPSVVTRLVDPATGGLAFRRRNVFTGAFELQIGADHPGSRSEWTHTVWAWHGFAIGYSQPRSFPSSTPEEVRRHIQNVSRNVLILNLWTGERRDIPDLGVLTSMHHSHPWGIFVRVVNDDERAVVVDLETGRRVTDMSLSQGAVGNGWMPFFVGDDLIAIANPDGAGSFKQEIRRFLTGDLVKTINRPPNYLTLSPDGKAAWYDGGTPQRLIVEEFPSGKLLLVDDAPAHGEMQDFMYPPRFSADGRMLLSPGSGALIDLERGTPIWRTKPNEQATHWVPPDAFEVAESWTLGASGRSTTFKTFALRKTADGSFLSRTWVSTAYPSNSDHSLLMADRAVHQLPPRVNWWLVITCQFVLALPLILLWFALLWRRKRCERRVAAASP